ncbi:hypothetical protein EI171_27250 [Bradyrhizobium sp. LCT2]|uniref:hypothetical protein n=1 Tax=Bradyrhizobium sp. LCT2 TaxID=2493093 RepID=UPI001373B545|nr:hypothetical protein [Bradyrhizobium sp. LCT2]QHP70657.1 hypothetical protein EI171_27250 [Bradyrhizobium sp. LCT2]
MTQQLHRSLYGMVIIARIGSMKFLPIMNGGMRRPAARNGIRRLVRNRAGKPPRAGRHRFMRWKKSISDFGGYRAWQDLQ